MLPVASDDGSKSEYLHNFKNGRQLWPYFCDWTQFSTTGPSQFRSDLLRSSKLDWKMLPAASDDDDGSWVIGKMLLWKLRRTL